MKLSDLISVSSGTGTTNLQRPALQTNAANRSNSFESYLANERAPQSNNKSQARNMGEQGNPAQSEPRALNETNCPSQTSHSVQTDAPAKPVVENVEGTVVATEECTYSDICPEEILVADLAALFGISAQQLMALLAELGINLADGITPEQTMQLVLAVYGASSPVELLWQPEAAAVVEQANLLTQNYVPAEALPQGETTTQNFGQVLTETTDNGPVQVVETTSEQGGDLLQQNLTGQDDLKNPLSEQVVINDGPVGPAVKAAPEQKISGSDETINIVPAESEEVVLTDEEKLPEAAIKTENATAQQDVSLVNTNPNLQPISELSSNQFAEVQETFTASRPTTETVEVVKQLVDYMKVEVRPDTTELRLTLRPESLGEVTMRVITQNGIVTAQLFAESQRIKEIIESSLNELKNAMTEKGLQIGEMSAFVAEDGTDRENPEWKGKSIQMSGSRVSRIMRQNGMEEAGEIDEIDQDENDAPRNPLAVNYKA